MFCTHALVSRPQAETCNQWQIYPNQVNGFGYATSIPSLFSTHPNPWGDCQAKIKELKEKIARKKAEQAFLGYRGWLLSLEFTSVGLEYMA